MPSWEIHHETYHADEGIPIIDAETAHAAACQYAARYAPCKIRRVEPDKPGDTFVITSTDGHGTGLVVEVYEYEGEQC